MNEEDRLNAAARARMQPYVDTLNANVVIEHGYDERLANEPTDVAALLSAIRFAAHKHRYQTRKNADATPYIEHPIKVTEILAHTGGVRFTEHLIAAVLHDTVEDTDTTPDEILAHFGRIVRHWVMEVTDDKSLAKPVRKQQQVEKAPNLSRAAKQIKLADKIANITDFVESPPADWPVERKLEYLDWAERVIDGCRDASAPLAELFDQRVADARATLCKQ